jgi:uncharacterized spore protein YtfJ
MSLPDVIKAALDQMQLIAKTQTVVGEPITAGAVTLIPVSKVSVGFAAGGTQQDRPGGAGTGGGVTVTPVAFVSICEGTVHVHSLQKSDLDLGKLLALAPELVEKLAKWLDRKNEKKADESSH